MPPPTPSPPSAPEPPAPPTVRLWAVGGVGDRPRAVTRCRGVDLVFPDVDAAAAREAPRGAAAAGAAEGEVVGERAVGQGQGRAELDRDAAADGGTAIV